MESEIVQKLQAFLASGAVNDECRVVYLLAQIRKLLERSDSPQTQNHTLKFYCNWALHVKLDRNPAASDFLSEVDPILTISASLNQVEHERLNHLLTLQSFRDELKNFLSENGIDTVICDLDDHWNLFLHAYSNVVENCEIESRGTDDGSRGSLRVRSVSITPYRQDLNLVERRTFPMEDRKSVV